MSTPLPPEIFDLIVDHLRDEPTTLKNCCLVSRSWIPRTRRHLFAKIGFGSVTSGSIESWMAAFPDPSSSPAHYTRWLGILDLDTTTLTSTGALTWIRHFCNVVVLQLKPVSGDSSIPISLAQLRALSPTLKHLHLYLSSLLLHDLLDFICSFPLLEDLRFQFVTATDDIDDGRSTDLISPKFTGALSLVATADSVTRGLLALPGGLHFTKIMIKWPLRYAGSVNDVVSKCSGTLESLVVAYSSRELMPPLPFDISTVKKLKEVEFGDVGSSAQWIITTLQTAKIENLQRVTIEVGSYAPFTDPAGETACREWQDLDHALDRLWTSHSIRPEVKFREGERRDFLGKLVSDLMPKLASKGAVKWGVGPEHL